MTSIVLRGKRAWSLVLSISGLLILGASWVLQPTSGTDERCAGLPEAEIRRCIAAAANELAREQGSLWIIALSGMLLIALGAFFGLRKPPRSMSVREASHVLGAPIQEVRAMAADGTLPSYRDPSGQLHIEREAIVRLTAR